MSVVSLTLAKAHLNITGNADDELIQLYLDASEVWISNYIGKALPEPVPADLKLAILQLAAFRYEQREAAAFDLTIQLAPFGVVTVADNYRERWFGEDATDGG